MPRNLSMAEKVQIMTSFIRKEFYPAWTDEQSREVLTQAQRANQASLSHHIGTENGLVSIPISSEAMGAVIRIGGVDIFGVNSGTTVIQTHHGSGDNVAGDKYQS